MNNTIDLRQPVNGDTQRLRGAAEAFANQMQSEYGIAWRWEGNSIAFDCPMGLAKGTTGSVALEQSAVHVRIVLPFMLSGARGKIEAGVREKLSKLV